MLQDQAVGPHFPFADDEERQLWEAHWNSPCARSLNALVLRYRYIVPVIQKRLRGGSVLLEPSDLESEGYLGLLQAIENYDASRGASFPSFAYSRVWGSMRDALRRVDPLGRPRRTRLRQCEQRAEALSRTLGRAPSQHEVALSLGITPEDLARLEGSWSFVLANGLDAREGSPDALTARTDLWDSAPENPYEVAERASEMQRVKEAHAKLSERERTVLHAYFTEDLSLQEIATKMGVTEARICQIKQKALSQIRTHLKVPPAPARSRQGTALGRPRKAP